MALLLLLPAVAGAQVPCQGGYVALTIDDGPGPDTPAVLDTLKAAGLKATFFMIGSYVQSYPAIAQRIVAEGHVVANHSWSHPVMNTLTQAQVDAEIVNTNNQVYATTGIRPAWFRPPYGQSNQMVYDRAVAAGLIHLWWTIDTEDYTGLTATDVLHQASLAQPGGVVLLHNWSPGLKGAIPLIASYWSQYSICMGRLAVTTNVMPVHDWWGQVSYVKAVQW